MRSGTETRAERALPDEVPVAFVYNGVTQAVMMATPRDLEDFGRGFTQTEGWGAPDSIEVVERSNGIEIRMLLPPERAHALFERRRSMSGAVGCGLCGIESLDQAVRGLPAVTSELTLDRSDVVAAMRALRAAQPLHDLTRAVHGAGFYVPGRGLVAVREDVGRHNALDKLIGAVGDCSSGAVVLTSRVSVEMVQKSALAGAPIILAVSAPTTLAVQSAREANITVVALARGEGFEVFTHGDRVGVESIEVVDVH